MRRPFRLGLFAAAMLSAAATASLPAQGLVLEADPGPTWSFRAAILRYRGGLSGPVELYGIGLDGSRTLLFRARPDYATELEARFWMDAGLDSLEAVATAAGGGELRTAIALARADGPDAAALSDARFPYREMPWGRAPRSADFAGNDPGQASRAASASLFAAGREPRNLAVPAAWAALAVAMALVFRGRAKRRWPVAASLAGAAAGAVLAAVTVAPRAQIWILEMPASDLPFTAELHAGEGDGYDLMRWSPPEGGDAGPALAIGCP